MVKLVFARHGESEWNKANLFTGWADVDLSDKGTQQAIDAGKLIKEAGIEFDQAYTSVLKRAIKTTNLALEAADQLWVPVEKSWRLNERHYGGLTGKNKAEAAEQFGDEQVHIWRRSYDVLPPAMPHDDEYSAHTDRRYASLDDSVIPDAENLKVTLLSTCHDVDVVNTKLVGIFSKSFSFDAVFVLMVNTIPTKIIGG